MRNYPKIEAQNKDDIICRSQSYFFCVAKLVLRGRETKRAALMKHGACFIQNCSQDFSFFKVVRKRIKVAGLAHNFNFSAIFKDSSVRCFFLLSHALQEV
jgi:hypothetical protein